MGMGQAAQHPSRARGHGLARVPVTESREKPLLQRVAQRSPPLEQPSLDPHKHRQPRGERCPNAALSLFYLALQRVPLAFHRRWQHPAHVWVPPEG
jgi:hypothetical protein